MYHNLKYTGKIHFLVDSRMRQASTEYTRSASNPIDLPWLRERCDDDDELVLEVLRSFLKQGLDHTDSLNSIRFAKLDPDLKIRRLMFHAVKPALQSF